MIILDKYQIVKMIDTLYKSGKLLPYFAMDGELRRVFLENEITYDSDFRLWNIEDIKKCGSGAVFFHITLGGFILVRDFTSDKLVARFENGDIYKVVSSKYPPFNMPIKKL